MSYFVLIYMLIFLPVDAYCEQPPASKKLTPDYVVSIPSHQTPNDDSPITLDLVVWDIPGDDPEKPKVVVLFAEGSYGAYYDNPITGPEHLNFIVGRAKNTAYEISLMAEKQGRGVVIVTATSFHSRGFVPGAFSNVPEDNRPPSVQARNRPFDLLAVLNYLKSRDDVGPDSDISAWGWSAGGTALFYTASSHNKAPLVETNALGLNLDNNSPAGREEIRAALGIAKILVLYGGCEVGSTFYEEGVLRYPHAVPIYNAVGDADTQIDSQYCETAQLASSVDSPEIPYDLYIPSGAEHNFDYEEYTSLGACKNRHNYNRIVNGLDNPNNDAIFKSNFDLDICSIEYY